MAGSYNEALSNIRQYATEAQDAQESQMDVDVSSAETRLDSTLKELQDRVKQQQIALDKVLRHIAALSSPKAQNFNIKRSYALHLQAVSPQPHLPIHESV